MAWIQHRQTDTYISIPTIADRVPVTLSPTVANAVILAASAGQRPVGLTIASQVAGVAVTVAEETSVAKAIAGASLGVNTEVGIASTNGALGPISGASGVARWAVGVSRSAAAAGETFSVYVNPRQISNLI